MSRRDWCPILIDAGLRGISPTALAKEQHCSTATAWKAARRWGVLLRNPNLAHDRNRPQAAETLKARRGQWWRRELALAEAANETLNAFCARTGKGASAAKRRATQAGHTFKAPDARKQR